MESNNEQNSIIYEDPNRPVVQLENGDCFLANLDIPARKVSFGYILSLLSITIIAGASYLFNIGQSGRSTFIPMSLCLFMILAVFILHKRAGAAPRNWLSPDMFIVPVFCVFHFFYIVYYAFGLVAEDSEVFMFGNDKALLATFLCLCCLSGFLIGYEISSCFFKQSDFLPRLIPAPIISITFGRILIIFAIVFYWGMVFRVGLSRVMTDYQALLNVGQLAGGRLFWVSLDFAMVGIAIYCAASGLLYNKAMYGKIFFFASWGFILGILVMGDRGAFIRLVPVPVMAFHYFQHKIKLKWMVIAVLSIVFISGALALTRTVVLLNIKQIKSEYDYQSQGSQYNFISRAGLEFGATIKIVVAAVAIVPKEYPYRYGRSYINSMNVLIPNVIPGRVRTSEKAKSLPLWINTMAYGQDLKWGRGGSIVMESYLNFGFFGSVIFFTILGCGYRCIYEWFLAKPGFIQIVLVLTATSGMMLWIRNALDVAIRPPVWGFVFAVAIQLLFSVKTNQNHETEEALYKGDL
jgi:oligosaccharide repeat unit polymerase